jgi:hypothetical protein
MASRRATHAPEIDAVRVPPSAWMTSQSSTIWRSPSSFISVTARSDLPISRWISCVRPDCLPFAASRLLRVLVARGSMPYSAVTQPSPLPRMNGGTFSSTDAVTSTLVSPKPISTEPSACLVKRGSIVMLRIWSGVRPDGRMIYLRGQWFGRAVVGGVDHVTPGSPRGTAGEVHRKSHGIGSLRRIQRATTFVRPRSTVSTIYQHCKSTRPSSAGDIAHKMCR